MTTFFCYCPLVDILFEVLKIGMVSSPDATVPCSMVLHGHIHVGAVDNRLQLRTHTFFIQPF